MNACIVYLIKFNITITCIIIFQSECTHVIILFVYYIANIIYLTSSKFSPLTDELVSNTILTIPPHPCLIVLNNFDRLYL